MSVNVDYVAIALITVFTSLCTSLGQEFGRELVKYVKGRVRVWRSSCRRI